MIMAAIQPAEPWVGIVTCESYVLLGPVVGV